jgi:hypothetical protein
MSRCNAFACLFAASGMTRDVSNPRTVPSDGSSDLTRRLVNNHSVVLLDCGDELPVQAGPEEIQFLRVFGKPIE